MTQEQVINTRKKIGKAIKAERLKWKYSYYELALNSGVSIGAIHKIEDGSTAYTVDSLIKICQFLKIETIELPTLKPKQ